VPTHRGESPTVAVDVEGRDLWGRRVQVAVAGPAAYTLFLFLSADCDGCRPLWALVRRPSERGLGPVRVRAVVDPRGWRRRLAIGRLAGLRSRGRVVRSPAAFGAYRVHAPFFVLVEGDGPSVVTEGVAFGADDVVGYVTRAIANRLRSEA
jgi:hypothetical protein